MNDYQDRRYILIAIFLVVAITYIFRLFYIQVIDDSYKLSANNLALKHVTLYPPRGLIYDRNNKLLVYNEDTKLFYNDNGNIKKVIEFKYDLLNKTPKNKLYGFLKYEKNKEISFKITDIVEKGDKKSVKGITCTSPSTTIIKNNLAKLDPKIIKNIIYNSKTSLCIDFEMLLKHNDTIKLNNKKWFYTPEEYYIYFEYNKT